MAGTTTTSPQLRELRFLRSNLRIMFALLFALTVSMLAYVAVRLFVLRDRMAHLEPLILWYFAFAAVVLTYGQLHLLRRMRRDACEKIEMMTFVDELTGVYNYRYLELRLSEEVQRAERHQSPVSCIYFDFDHFKQVNDVYGHETGNTVLRRGAETARVASRGEDFVGRLGGDEFLIVLPQTDGAGALIAAERIKKKLDAMILFSGNGERIELLTFSMGVATCPTDATTRDALVHAADQAMYRAKRAGGDRICTCDPLPADPVEEPCSVAP